MCFFKKNNKQIDKPNNNLPKDVSLFIKENFNNNDSRIVTKFLERKYDELINVGKEQYIRSILFLLEGSINNIKKYKTISDPRDIVSLANTKSENKFDFFNKPLK